MEQLYLEKHCTVKFRRYLFLVTPTFARKWTAHKKRSIFDLQGPLRDPTPHFRKKIFLFFSLCPYGRSYWELCEDQRFPIWANQLVGFLQPLYLTSPEWRQNSSLVCPRELTKFGIRTEKNIAKNIWLLIAQLILRTEHLSS